MTSPFSLEGKAALVTGGNQGLGKAFALGLARRAPGSRSQAGGPTPTRWPSRKPVPPGHELVPLTADITETPKCSR